MTYTDISLIVAGALDEEAQFTDETLLSEWLTNVEEELIGSGYRGEVYRIDHDHDPGADCECAQYLTDHKPYRILNPDGQS